MTRHILSIKSTYYGHTNRISMITSLQRPTFANDRQVELDIRLLVSPLRRCDRVCRVESKGRAKCRRIVVLPSRVLVSVPVDGLVQDEVLISGRSSVGEGRRVNVPDGGTVEAGPQTGQKQFY